jgi:hypothetical protein
MRVDQLFFRRLNRGAGGPAVVLIGLVALAAIGAVIRAEHGPHGSVPNPPATAPGSVAQPIKGNSAATDNALIVPGTPGGGAAAAQTSGVSPDLTVPQDQKVIRTGDLTINIKKGGFQGTRQQAEEIVTAKGGFLDTASSPVTGDTIRSGDLTFKVPASKFEDTLNALGTIGKVQGMSVSGQDVGQQYVDLQARLTSEEDYRSAMLALLAKATTVQDTLSVYNQLTPIQTAIEQLQGQISYLDSATTYYPITLHLAEPDAVVSPPPSDDWGFRTAVSQALHSFVGTINDITLALGTLGPILILIGFGLVARRWGWMTRRAAPVRAS